MTDLLIQQVSWLGHSAELRLIRQKVFIDEQGVEQREEWDAEDDHAVHFIAYWQNQAVGTVRLQKDGKIGRMAVLASYRRRGFARALLEKLLGYAKNNNFPSLFLHAQTQVVAFYERFGFSVSGEQFVEAGIPHQLMTLDTKNTAITRFETVQDAQAAIQKIIRGGRRFVDILTQRFDPQLYHCPILAEASSQLVRQHHSARVRVLVKDSRALGKQHHYMVNLVQKMPSRMAIRQLTEEPSDSNMGFCIVDRKRLVYFNHEENYIGFASSEAKAEARHFLDEFDYLWQEHSLVDPNLRILNL